MHGLSPKTQSTYVLYKKIWEILDWIYPPRCGGCSTTGSRWCEACQSQVILVEGQLCPVCGQKQHKAGLCHRCLVDPPVYIGLRSWALFEGPVRQALHRLKYGHDIALGEILARPMHAILERSGWHVDCIVAVPLGSAHRAERGYNQAALLAIPLALASGIPYRSKGLTRIRETRTQVGLNPDQRRANVEGAFQADSRFVQGKTVLVVDDVTTSGATMNSCASAIMLAGADQVYGMTLAQAGNHPESRKVA